MHKLTWELREDGGYRGFSQRIWVANVRRLDWHPEGHWAWDLDVVRGSRERDIALRGDATSENSAKKAAEEAWFCWFSAAGLTAEAHKTKPNRDHRT